MNEYLLGFLTIVGGVWIFLVTHRCVKLTNKVERLCERTARLEGTTYGEYSDKGE